MYGLDISYSHPNTPPNIEIKIIQKSSEPTPPITVSLIASYPFPSNSSLCPGKTDKAVFSSGAPRKIEGMKLIKICVTAIEIIKTVRLYCEVNKNDKERIKGKILFMCIPGSKPRGNPIKIPSTANKIVSNITTITLKFLYRSAFWGVSATVLYIHQLDL